MLSPNSKNCLIWPRFPVRAVEADTAGRMITVFLSFRAGGDYKLTPEVAERLTRADSPVDERTRLHLTSMLVDMRAAGDAVPEITLDMIERARLADDLHVDVRADRLLWSLGRITRRVGQAIDTTSQSAWIPSLLACTESTSETETAFLKDYLLGQGWIEGDPGYPVVSVHGYARLAYLASGQNSDQVFVAIWFSDEMEQVYTDAIEPAVIEAGYNPQRVGQGQTTDRIDDEAEAKIRKARLVIADFSHGEDGVRGSVYYEAGFARALGKPVIFTAKKGSQIHFNVDHFLRLEWVDAEDLRTRLTQRIRNLPELQL